jgi:hypothetical protein
MKKGFPKRTTLPVKQRKSGQVHRARETTTEDFYLPMVDPDFPITERDPVKLHAFARGGGRNDDSERNDATDNPM